MLLPAIATALLALAASSWRWPTRVEIEFTTRRLAFTTGDTENPVLNVRVPFSSLVTERCDTMTFVPSELAVTDPASPTPQPLTLPDRTVRLACRDPDSKLTLRPPEATSAKILGTVDRFQVDAGARVVLEAHATGEIDKTREAELTVDIDRARTLTLTAPGELAIEAEFVELESDGAVPITGDFRTYHARLEDPDPWLELGFTRDPTVIIVLPAAKASGIFVSTPIPIETVELLYETLTGELVSPLLSEATLSYPEFPSIGAVTIPRDELLGIGELGTAQLKGLELDAVGSFPVKDAGAAGLRLTFDGIAGKARSTDLAFSTDYRLTVWDRFAHGSLWQRLTAAVAWALATAWIGRERWQKLSAGR